MKVFVWKMFSCNGDSDMRVWREVKGSLLDCLGRRAVIGICALVVMV